MLLFLLLKQNSNCSLKVAVFLSFTNKNKCKNKESFLQRALKSHFWKIKNSHTHCTKYLVEKLAKWQVERSTRWRVPDGQHSTVMILFEHTLRIMLSFLESFHQIKAFPLRCGSEFKGENFMRLIHSTNPMSARNKVVLAPRRRLSRINPLFMT